MVGPAHRQAWASPDVLRCGLQFCLTIKCLLGLPLRQTWGRCNRCSKWLAYPGQRPTTAQCAAGKRAWMWGCTTVQAIRGCTCLLTPRVSSSWGKANGKPRNMAQSVVASGARFTWVSMPRRCRFGQLFIVVSTNEVGDSPIAADLLGHIPSHEKVASFTGDGAYGTKDVHEAC